MIKIIEKYSIEIHVFGQPITAEQKIMVLATPLGYIYEFVFDLPHLMSHREKRLLHIGINSLGSRLSFDSFKISLLRPSDEQIVIIAGKDVIL